MVNTATATGYTHSVKIDVVLRLGREGVDCSGPSGLSRSMIEISHTHAQLHLKSSSAVHTDTLP